MESIFENIRRKVSITSLINRFGIILNQTGKALCPFHNEDTPSFSVKEKEGIFKCFGCGESGDAVDFIVKINGVEPMAAAMKIAEMFGIEQTTTERYDKSGTTVSKSRKQRLGSNERLSRDISDYITACEAEIGCTDYFIKRGLSEQTIKQFRLGYDAKKDCIVIPYLSEPEYYQTRSVSGKTFRKPPTVDAGSEPIWNGKALIGGSPVFIVESPICAISIIQCGGQAVSICGTGGGTKLINELKTTISKCTLILSLDNDAPGQKAQQDIANKLTELNIKFIATNISGKTTLGMLRRQICRNKVGRLRKAKRHTSFTMLLIMRKILTEKR